MFLLNIKLIISLSIEEQCQQMDVPVDICSKLYVTNRPIKQPDVTVVHTKKENKGGLSNLNDIVSVIKMINEFKNVGGSNNCSKDNNTTKTVTKSVSCISTLSSKTPSEPNITTTSNPISSGSSDITVTRILTSTISVEKPLTLYREMTTTITKIKPVVNYKVTTFTTTMYSTIYRNNDNTPITIPTDDTITSTTQINSSIQQTTTNTPQTTTTLPPSPSKCVNPPITTGLNCTNKSTNSILINRDELNRVLSDRKHKNRVKTRTILNTIYKRRIDDSDSSVVTKTVYK